MTSVPFADDPVWTPIDPRDGETLWSGEGRATLDAASKRAAESGAWTIVARWDAEQPGWIIAPPPPVEVTGVPSRYEVVANDGETATWFTDAKEAWASADRFSKRQPEHAPFSVEACIPVARNEANDG